MKKYNLTCLSGLSAMSQGSKFRNDSYIKRQSEKAILHLVLVDEAGELDKATEFGFAKRTPW